jgi:conjugative transfer signal peptidase TraF
MPEARHLPLFRWGEELRRLRVNRCSSRRRIAAASVAGLILGALAGSLVWPTRPLFVWNGSPSSPVGLYHVTDPEDLKAGDMAVAWAPHAARRLAAERRYLPDNIPLVKHVVAARRDRVCAAGEAVFVNGRFVALRQRQDPAGRLLPWWTGCHNLKANEVFLLMPGAADSFDGRYFGVTEGRQIIGRARLIWAA